MLKKKLVLFLSIFLLVGVTYTTQNVRGHPPSSMSLSYNTVSEELTVSITHNVGDPNDHYVFRVRIWVNASIVNTSQYTSQPSSSTFAYIYDIIAGNGSSIQVTADCIQGGSITRFITIGSSNGQNEGPAIPGFLEIVPIIAISVFIITIKVFQIRKNTIKES
ncbi:MAG: hypothetical protein ACFFCY_07725 [Promethearchaeota archaeon]